MKMMKGLTFLVLLIPLMGMNTLAQNSEVQKLMDNKETREEIYKSIMNDHTLMMEFLGNVQGNDHAKAMLQRHHAMYEAGEGENEETSVGSGQHMMGMQEGDSEMIHHETSETMHHETSETMHQGNKDMMHQMMGYLQENPEMMPAVMGNMLDMCENDSTMCNPMAEVLGEHPHMMKMCFQKLSENERMEITSEK